jgi:hypothetical protein
MNNQDAARHLFINGVINLKTFKTLIKRSEKLQAKQAKEARQVNVNGAVAMAVTKLLEDNEAIQHRPVWNLVGREEATRDEVLNGLRALRTEGVLESFKKSGNNFQVFWRKPQVKTEETDEEAS